MDAHELEGIPLFADLSKKERARVARWADVVEVQPGYHLLEEGRFPHEFFVILDGTAVVVRGDERLRELTRGDFMGEIALLEMEHETRTASVIAESPMRVAVMSARDFDEMCLEIPAVQRILETAARERLQH